IHGLFSGRYYGLVRRVLRVSMAWAREKPHGLGRQCVVMIPFLVVPCVFALARCDSLVSEPGYKEVAMPSNFHKKFRWITVFATGCRSFIEPGIGFRMKGTNRRTRVPIGLYPCHIKEKMTIKEVRGESVIEWKTNVTTKEGIIIQFPRKFHGYELATKEEVEDNEGLKEVWE
nr:hypothetical protein [Tanacetum cinerariifolium]